PDDREEVRRVMDRARRERVPYSSEHRIVLPDATIRWILTQARYSYNDAGEAVEHLGVAIDVTERKRAEEAIRRNSEQLRLAMEAARMATWDEDLRTGLITLSITDESIFGDAPGTYHREQLIHRIHPEDREGVGRALENARRERTLYSREVRFVLP